MLTKEMLKQMKVERVVFNGRTTIVILQNGAKGVSKCSESDYNDPMVGFSVAYALAMSGVETKKQFKENVNYANKKGTFVIKSETSKINGFCVYTPSFDSSTCLRNISVDKYRPMKV